MDRIGGTERCLVSVYCAALGKDEVREGQVLAGTQLRRPEDATWPRSISVPVYKRQTATATAIAIANRYAPHLMSLPSDSQLPTGGDDQA